MSADEVHELLGATLHGPLPDKTVRRTMATLSAWLPLVKMVNETHLQVKGECCGEPNLITMLGHMTFCDKGHLDMVELLERMQRAVDSIEENRKVLLGLAGQKCPAGDSNAS